MLQRAGDVDPKREFAERVRQQAGLSTDVSLAEIKHASAALVIDYTTEYLEGIAKSVPPAASSAQHAPGGGAVMQAMLSQRFNVDTSGFGPEPVLRAPAPRDLARARTRLAVLRPGRKLGSEDARVLLEQTAWSARRALIAVRWGSNLGTEALSSQRVQGACGYGQACTAYHLQDLGLPADKIHIHQAANAFGDAASFRHAFVVAEMPDGKAYLVDCTFRQFFRPDDDGPNHVGEPGRIMRGTRRGREIANELLANGFVELTDEVASAYGAALTATPGLQVSASSLLRSTEEIDYDRGEMALLPAPPPFAPSGPALGGEEPPKNRGPP